MYIAGRRRAVGRVSGIVGFPPTGSSVPENIVEKEVPVDIVGGATQNAVKKSTKKDAKNMKTKQKKAAPALHKAYNYYVGLQNQFPNNAGQFMEMRLKGNHEVSENDNQGADC